MKPKRLRAHLVESLEPRQLFSTYLVTSAADSGVGTLRQAILDANAKAGADIVNFNINGGGTAKIALTSALPTFTESVIIDGTTQPGYAGKPRIEVSGGGIVGIGFDVSASGSTIKGLVINGFTNSGIL